MIAKALSAIKRDPELRKRLDKRIKIMDGCRLPKAKEIRKRSLRLADKVMLTNVGAWALYFVPAAAVGACYKFLKQKVRQLVSLPERDLKVISKGSATCLAT